MFAFVFQMPKMQFRSNAKPSVYAYPEPLKPPKKEEKEKVWFAAEDHSEHYSMYLVFRVSMYLVFRVSVHLVFRVSFA